MDIEKYSIYTTVSIAFEDAAYLLLLVGFLPTSKAMVETSETF